MPNFVKVSMIALAAFVLPIGVVATMHWDSVKRYLQVNPQDVHGHVLYFTTYG